VNEVYAATRRAVLPQVSFLCGPMGAGKSVLGKALCEKTNMQQLRFNDWIKENNLTEADDETITGALIQYLAAQTCPRVLIENFPQTEL
jgi:broad-specificity NMP kinase